MADFKKIETTEKSGTDFGKYIAIALYAALIVLLFIPWFTTPAITNITNGPVAWSFLDIVLLAFFKGRFPSTLQNVILAIGGEIYEPAVEGAKPVLTADAWIDFKIRILAFIVLCLMIASIAFLVMAIVRTFSDSAKLKNVMRAVMFPTATVLVETLVMVTYLNKINEVTMYNTLTVKILPSAGLVVMAVVLVLTLALASVSIICDLPIASAFTYTGKRNQEIDKSMSVVAQRIVAYVVLVIVSVLCLIWFYILIVNTTRSKGELTMGFTPLPSTHLFENFKNLFNDATQNVLLGLRNSLIVSSACAVVSTYFSAMTAYAIHAYEFKLKKFLFAFILAIMMIPTQVTALGFINLVGRIGLDNNLLALIIPTIAAPVTFFYMKQYMESTLPMSLLEAARIDGSGEFRTFNTIVTPLMKPAIAVQAIFTFVSAWNNYFTPALILHESKTKTLPILIAQLRGADFLKFDMGKVYAEITFSILPVIIIYLILSKQIVQGMAVGAVKG